jgi:hypothetical protein
MQQVEINHAAYEHPNDAQTIIALDHNRLNFIFYF